MTEQQKLGQPVATEAHFPLSREIPLTQGWKFFLGDYASAKEPWLDDSGWQDVCLPHDFSICQPFSAAWEAESAFLPGGVGWYRRSCHLPAGWAGKRVLLEFGGAYASAWVYVNGQYLGENHYGYGSFALDISGYVQFGGETVIAVRVENPIPTSRWYSGSGLYRRAWLTVTGPVYIDRYGITVTTPEKGRVAVAARLGNAGANPAEITLRHTILDGDTPLAQWESGFTLDGRRQVTASLHLPEPRLWSPDSPAMYTLATELTSAGEVLDRVETPFGFRWFRFTESGFYLNGEPAKLKGMCLHADQGALGAAAYPGAIARQLRLMKDMGANAVRTSHHAPEPAFLDICDRLGLLVVEDSFDCWSKPRNGNLNDFSRYFLQPLGKDNRILDGTPEMTWSEHALRTMIRRDRNHPCLILWSLANEVQEGGTGPSPQFPAIARDLVAWVGQEDPTRPATVSDNTKGRDPVMAQVARIVYQAGGVVGYNYASPQQLDERAYPVLLSSETSSSINSRGVYRVTQGDDGNYHLTAYDTTAVPWGTTAHESLYATMVRDFVAGEFVWTGFDYLGEPTPWNGVSPGPVTSLGAAPNSSYFGVVETTGFPKDTYWFYRSQWNRAANTLHLVTAWDSRNMAPGNPVWIYSNAFQVELLCNGQPVGRALRRDHVTPAGHRYHTYETESLAPCCRTATGEGARGLFAAFSLTYVPGELTALAFGEDGAPLKAQGRHRVVTPGPAAKIRLTCSCQTAWDDQPIYGEITITDCQGNLDTTAAPLLQVGLSGPGELLGLDNGDPATTEKYQQPSVLLGPDRGRIRAWAGKALVIFRAAGPGEIRLTEESPGLETSVETVTAQPPAPSPTFTLVRDVTVLPGQIPALPQKTAEGHRIQWAAMPDTAVPGDYPVAGQVYCPDISPVPVTGRVHVAAPVVALQNVAVAVAPGTLPNLPATVRGLLAGGSHWGEFPVQWEPGSDGRVSGRAMVYFAPMPVTAQIRVTEETSAIEGDVAPAAAQVDRLPGSLTYHWDTAQNLSRVEMPGDGTFAYSLNGTDYLPLPAKRSGGVYAFGQTVNPIALRITGDNLPEGIRIVSVFGAAAAGTAAALQEIRIDGAPLPGFSPACREYHLAAAPERVSATAVDHGAVSVLPPAGGKQVIAVLSEDGKAFARYTLCFDHG